VRCCTQERPNGQSRTCNHGYHGTDSCNPRALEGSPQRLFQGQSTTADQLYRMGKPSRIANDDVKGAREEDLPFKSHQKGTSCGKRSHAASADRIPTMTEYYHTKCKKCQRVVQVESLKRLSGILLARREPRGRD